MSQQRDDADGNGPVDPPVPPDPEAVADAPQVEPEDAERPVDDEEFVHPSEQDEATPPEAGGPQE